LLGAEALPAIDQQLTELKQKVVRIEKLLENH